MHSEPNFSLPWQRKRQYSSTSSGFVIPGNRILTNAHCVDHHTQVQLLLSPCLHAMCPASAPTLMHMHVYADPQGVRKL